MSTRATFHRELVALPFFGPEHAALAADIEAWSHRHFPDGAHDESRAAVDARARSLVSALGSGGFTRYCVRAEFGGALPEFDSRAICLIRETLAYYDGLADFSFAMQGLGSGALSLAATRELAGKYLPKVARGEAIAAFALSEPDAGSDVAAMQMSARREGDHFVLEGTKTWISNGGIADFYCVFARTEAGQVRADGTIGSQGISAFVVEPSDAGFSIESRIDVLAPHPLATLRFRNCRIPAARLIGNAGEGFKIAMRTLDVFRASVAAAALGFARRALDEARNHALQRPMFGRRLADFQLTQAALAEMATGIDSAALLTYRAAWLRDRGEPVTKAAAMAKLTATENAQSIIDRGLQMLGGLGVVSGGIMERLYRDIRALRIYEGASEVQKLIIGREVLK